MNVREKFEQAKSRAAELKAKGDQRSEDETTEMLEMLDRAEQLKPEVEKLDAVDARLEKLAGVSRSVALPGTDTRPAPTPPELSAGEYFAAVAEYLNDRDEAKFLDRAGRYHDRATGVTADVAGVLPDPIVGPVIDTYDARRRVFASFTSRPMPATGKTFERPKVTQHVSVGAQAAEGDTLASQKFTLDADTITKATIGGTLEVSRQMQDWTDPAALGLVIADFMAVYARFTEAQAVTHLTGLATATSAWDATSTTTIVDSFVTGALAVCTAVDNDLPLAVWLDTASAAALTAPTGSTDRTVWSVVREAMAALDSEVSWIVSRRLPANTRIIGVPGLVESYEQRHGLLSLVKPTNLTTDISYSGYVAFHGIADGFVSVETP